MKILILYNLLPYPNADHGGGIYVFNFIKHFSKEHEIFLYCTYFRKNRAKIKEIKKYVKEFKGFEIKQDSFSISELIKFLGKYFVSKYPIFNNFIFYDDMANSIKDLLNKEQIDLVYCENTIIAHYLDEIPEGFAGKIYLHDDELFFIAIKRNFLSLITENLKNLIRRQFDLYKVFQLLEYLQFRKYKKYEIRLWKKVDYLSASSAVEKKIIQKILPSKIVNITYYGTDIIQKNSSDPKDSNILFVGNYTHYPNVDAVLHFCSDIFPLIQKKNKKAKFLITGRNPPKSFFRIAKKNSFIKVMGFVDNLKDLYDKAQVFVCPIRLGGGIRVKIFEPLGYGIPIVSTSIGIEGIYDLVKSKEVILCADKPKEFASKVIKLLNEPHFRKTYINRGQNFIRSFSWKDIFQNLESDLGLKQK